MIEEKYVHTEYMYIVSGQIHLGLDNDHDKMVNDHDKPISDWKVEVLQFFKFFRYSTLAGCSSAGRLWGVHTGSPIKSRNALV